MNHKFTPASPGLHPFFGPVGGFASFTLTIHTTSQANPPGDVPCKAGLLSKQTAIFLKKLEENGTCSQNQEGLPHQPREPHKKKKTPGKFQLFAKSVHLTHQLEGPRKNQLEIQLPKKMLRISMFSRYLPSRKLT